MLALMLNELRQFWLQLQLIYYRAARDNLTRVDPCHPELPDIVHKINELESGARAMPPSALSVAPPAARHHQHHPRVDAVSAEEARVLGQLTQLAPDLSRAELLSIAKDIVKERQT